MSRQSGFAKALRRVRKARGFTQEDFSNVSSRTYLSALERGLQSPTLDKVEALCSILNVHPATLLLLAYSQGDSPTQVDRVLAQVRKDLNSLAI